MKSMPTLHEKLPGLRRVFAHMWPYVRRYRVLLAGSLTSLVLQAVFQSLEPWPLKYLFDTLVHTKHSGRLPEIPGLHDLSPSLLVGLAALAIVTIAGLRVVADYAS